VSHFYSGDVARERKNYGKDMKDQSDYHVLAD